MNKFTNIIKTVTFYGLIVLVVYLIFIDFAQLKLNTADGSTYLNIADNILSGKGFVVSFNLYQFFNTLYHPLWAYMHPIYPFFCALVLSLKSGIDQAVRANIVLLGINAALIFYITRRIITTPLNVLFLLIIILTYEFYVTALFPWTEQLHLTFFLVSFILFIRFYESPKWLFIIGLLNGFCMLIRFAHLYNVLAFLLVIFLMEGKLREKIKRMLYFTGGFLLIFGTYECFVKLYYHSWYPQYVVPAMLYSKARATDLASYAPDQPGIHVPSIYVFKHKDYFLAHVAQFVNTFAPTVLPAIFLLNTPFRNKQEKLFLITCVWQSIFIILGYSYSFAWYNSLDTVRYVLVPLVLLSIAGWFYLCTLFIFSSTQWKRWFGIFFLLAVFVYISGNYVGTRIYLLEKKHQNQQYQQNLYASFDWIDKNLPKEILVASDEDQEGYLMHRPFITMPVGKSYHCTNLKAYHKIYKPDYYLISNQKTDECFASIPHQNVYTNNRFRILHILK